MQQLQTLISDWEAFARTKAAAGSEWEAADEAFRIFVERKVEEEHSPLLPLEGESDAVEVQ